MLNNGIGWLRRQRVYSQEKDATLSVKSNLEAFLLSVAGPFVLEILQVHENLVDPQEETFWDVFLFSPVPVLRRVV